jgi:hypothetical protein
MSLSPIQSNPTPPANSIPPAAASPLRLPSLHIPDVLINNPSLIQTFTDIINSIIDCAKRLWDMINRFIGTRPASPATLFSCTAPLVICPSTQPHSIQNSNKIFVYNMLTQGRDMSGDRITVQKFTLNSPQTLETLPLFNVIQPNITLMNGPFAYDNSTADTAHWTANFADSNLFGYCEGPLLAQDELQVLEHPALAHLKHALPADHRVLQPCEAALFQNVPRLGSLDTSTPLPNGLTLYGTDFVRASEPDIQSRLTRFPIPTSSNIFAIAAPRISDHLTNQPYQRRDLATLFFTAYNAFRSAKEASPGKRVVIHTGNWGAGAFGNGSKTVHLIQLAAARFAGVEEIRMYPMSQQAQYQEAKQLYTHIGSQFPQLTVGQFLDHLTSNASGYNLRYGQGNGT